MEKQERKSRTVRLRRTELVIWFIIVLVIISLGVFLWVHHEKSFETHEIRMADVYGLIVGSPVNLMGIPIGYVTKTKIINDDEIRVKFKVTNKDVHIQSGTIATVEFNGLGGSKSLELYPPQSSKNIPTDRILNTNGFILVERPIRLRDCWSLLYEMYQKIVNIIYSISIFGNDLSHIDGPVVQSGTTSSITFINYADSWIDNSSGSMRNFRKVLEKYKGKK